MNCHPIILPDDFLGQNFSSSGVHSPFQNLPVKFSLRFHKLLNRLATFLVNSLQISSYRRTQINMNVLASNCVHYENRYPFRLLLPIASVLLPTRRTLSEQFPTSALPTILPTCQKVCQLLIHISLNHSLLDAMSSKLNLSKLNEAGVDTKHSCLGHATKH